MEFGMPTLIECPDLTACARLCAELGLDFIEINQSFPQYQPEKTPPNFLNELRERYGVNFSVHLDEAMNPLDFNARVAETYRQNAVQTIELARATGIEKLNLHLLYGVYVTLPDRRVYLNDEYTDEYLDNVRIFRSVCENAIGDASVKICVENTDLPFIPCQHRALDLLLQSPVFELTLDTGHDQASKHVDLPFFRKNIAKLSHMHLHNCRGTSPHLPLDDGDVDIREMLFLAQTAGCDCVIEVKTIDGLRRSVDYLRDRGYLQGKR